MNTLLFIQSVLEKDFAALEQKLMFVGICWIMVVVAIIIDLISGVHKAKLRGELRTSDGFKRTVSKFVLYYSALTIAFLADCIVNYVIFAYNNFIPEIPYFTIVLSLFLIVFVEGKSVIEKANEKQLQKLSKDVILAIEFISKIKDKEILEYLKKTSNNENNVHT